MLGLIEKPYPLDELEDPMTDSDAEEERKLASSEKPKGKGTLSYFDGHAPSFLGGLVRGMFARCFC